MPKLNLCSGLNRMDGYVNVDKYGEPDVKCDLEVFPWPWEDNSVDEIVSHAGLEHLGAMPDVFIGIMKELYRISKPDAKIHISVPYPLHEDFWSDPTHVRAITPKTITLFSKQLNRKLAAQGFGNSPLGLYHNIDFELEHAEYVIDEKIKDRLGNLKDLATIDWVMRHCNAVKEIRMTIRVIKEG